jgi:hypothetical protein
MRELLVVTAALHWCTAAVIVTAGGSAAFALWTLCATAVSMAWHWRGEPAGWLAVVDYTGAAGWLIFELALTRRLAVTLVLNGLVFALNRLCAGSEQYAIHHSAWHVISALKSIAVAQSCN